MSGLNGMPVSSRNLISFRASITASLRRHEPLHAIINVIPPGLFITMRFFFPSRVFYETLRLMRVLRLFSFSLNRACNPFIVPRYV